MKKLLFVFLLSFMILLPQASAKSYKDITPEQVYDNFIAVNEKNDIQTKVVYSEMVNAKDDPSIKVFLLFRGDAEGRVVMYKNEEGNIFKLICGGPTVDQNKEWSLMVIAVLKSLGLSEAECDKLIRHGSEDGYTIRNSLRPKNLDKNINSMITILDSGRWGMLLRFED